MKVRPTAVRVADSAAPSADPARAYLRRIGSVPLLTREGEVEICKRIEEGENSVLAAVTHSQAAIQEILDLGTELREGTLDSTYLDRVLA